MYEKTRAVAQKYGKQIGVGAGAMVLGVSNAFAVATIDYSGVVTAATAEVTASGTSIATLFGLTTGIAIVFSLMKKSRRL